MDDVSGNESISELFAHKYTTQLTELLALNENNIITNCSNNNTSLINKHTHDVSVDQLQNAIHKLKSFKSDCTDQLFSNHFIKGTLRFFTLIFRYIYKYVILWCSPYRIIVVYYGTCA